jgi:hypothetical protein
MLGGSLVRKLLAVLAVPALVWAVVFAVPGTALAGNPHFVDDQTTATVDGSSVTVTFKEAGLGDEDQVHVVLTADARCVNPGGNKPQAGNKTTFTVAGDFPVQNGHADGTLTVTEVFDPPCVPPMTTEWSNITLTDQTNGISVSL